MSASVADRPDWAVEGLDWPNRAASRFVETPGVTWHIQDQGDGPTVLLLHGAGAATHSWRDLLPLLAPSFRVIAPDLPGHGFTRSQSRQDLSLPSMTRHVQRLLEALKVQPSLVVGHSAGAAVALRLSLDGHLGPAPVVSINGALQPFAGMVAPVFQGLAMGLFANPLAVRLFTSSAQDPARVRRVLEGTGSRIDDRGLDLYGRLFRNAGHVAGTLGMMGHWDLRTLRRDLGRLTTPLHMVVGAGDLAVPPSVARGVLETVAHAQIMTLTGLGHLAHEERPDLVAEIVRKLAEKGP